MKNTIKENTLFIGHNFKSKGHHITAEKPAKFVFQKKEFDLKKIDETKAEELIKNGFPFLERIEKPKEVKIEAKVEPKAETKK